ncbi:hypothetical protein HU200_021301 [Digitaria exilis]|uniref:3-beta hydroxysteroid dehydrogenase/isomerase domain-containing protein n=1 Tax=Digitaria exilis TaxID=1010633 RepID=A0A835F062_9POAL|nr:hypothetical protein HU200_021301 [Digitaria exilis]
MAVAIDGTKNVINAAADMGVQRVVFTSSYGAVHMNPNRNPDQVVDESCWSDLEFCLETKNFYCYAKTVAEKTAMKEASKRGMDTSAGGRALIDARRNAAAKAELGHRTAHRLLHEGQEGVSQHCFRIRRCARCRSCPCVGVRNPPLRMDATSALAQWYTGRSLFK